MQGRGSMWVDMLPPLQCIIKRAQLSNTNQYLDEGTRHTGGSAPWVEAFCSERTANIQNNGQLSEVQNLPQAGLPQGSPCPRSYFSSTTQTSCKDKSTAREEQSLLWLISPHG
jgi:hypothetical protein